MTKVTAMEQQERAIQKAAPQEEQKHSETVHVRKAPGSGWATQAILAGAPIWELPRQSLEELAGRVGNSGMLALAAMRTPDAELRQTTLTGPEPQTPAMEVPDTACQLAPASELTAGTWPSGTYDPAGLA